MTFCLFQTIIWFAKIDLLDVVEESAPSYPIQSLIKDGLILKILFMNVYGCPLASSPQENLVHCHGHIIQPLG